jgi:hypothetical protein
MHVHITCEAREAKFWIEPIVALAIYHSLSPRRLKEIQKLIEDHKDEIIKAWEDHFSKR